MNKIHGLVAAVYPPLDSIGNLKLEQINPYAQHLAKNQVKGAFINGTSGNFTAFSFQERKLITEAWAASRPQGFKLIVHVGDTNLNQAVQLAKHAGELKVDAISSLAPYYKKPANNKELVAICKRIAEASPDIPFYYYHIPALSGSYFNMVEFLELAAPEIPNLAGIKFSDQNLVLLQECINYKNGQYDILFGVDEILLSAAALGINGAVGSTYNYIAPIHLKIQEQFQTGELDEAKRCQFLVQQCVTTLSKYDFYPASKAFLKLLGLDLGPVRFPHKELTSNEVSSLENELNSLGVFDMLHEPFLPR